MIQIRDQIKRIPIDELVPYAKNSRTHSQEQIEQLASSMREWGWTTPVLVDEFGGVIAGHGRIMAGQLLGIKEVPVIVADGWSESQKRAYVIADNKLALNAGWDEAALASEIALLQEDGYSVDLLGFSGDELEEMLQEDDSPGLTDEDACPEVQPDPISKLGDVWLLGNHRVMCGDSTSIETVKELMGGKLADQLITDPPYNVDYVGKTKKALKIQNDSMTDDSFRKFLRDAFVAADSVMKAGAVFYIWHADKEGYNFRAACKDSGWTVRQCLIWKKQTLVMGRQDYHWKHEPCLYGWKDGAGHLWAADRKQTTILEFDRPSSSTLHPTMKPVELIEYQVLNNTKGSDIVLDLFGGSGSSLIACEKTGREARLMELDPKYVDVIVKRWQEFTGGGAVLEKTGHSFDEVAEERGQQ